MTKAHAGGKAHAVRVSHLAISLALLAATILVTITPVRSVSASTTAAQSAIRPSPGCTDGPLQPSAQVLSFSSNGDTGSHLEQFPSEAASKKALPVVFDFHSYGLSGHGRALMVPK